MKNPAIPLPIGFKAGGIHCGIKKRHKDLALIYSEVPAIAAGMFTTNKVSAASVKLTKNVIANGAIQAIIANSGNANALTGQQGDHDALEMARITAGSLCIDISKVAVASTGPIGKHLPIKAISEGIENLAKKINPKSFADASQAIMTTDTFPKTISKKIPIGTHTITITAVAKGAGMIHPHMATMLCFITTDLKISQHLLQDILRDTVEHSFNCVTVDGCMSTNDTVLAMANGMAGNNIIESYGNEFNIVKDAFTEITKELAKMIARDGEGATKLIEIEIAGAPSFEDARSVGFSVANYDLLKCSFFGEVLNIGRIMAAIGTNHININPERINIYMDNIEILKNGEICHYSQDGIPQILKQKDVHVKIELDQGEGKATVWTCDLSPKYVKINMD